MLSPIWPAPPCRHAVSSRCVVELEKVAHLGEPAHDPFGRDGRGKGNEVLALQVECCSPWLLRLARTRRVGRLRAFGRGSGRRASETTLRHLGCWAVLPISMAKRSLDASLGYCPNERSDCLSKCICRGLQTITDVRELSRRKVNAVLLHLRALLLVVNAPLLAVSARFLAVGALANCGELLRQLLDRASKLGQLASDMGDVLFGRHVGRSLCRDASQHVSPGRAAVVIVAAFGRPAPRVC